MTIICSLQSSVLFFDLRKRFCWASPFLMRRRRRRNPLRSAWLYLFQVRLFIYLLIYLSRPLIYLFICFPSFPFIYSNKNILRYKLLLLRFCCCSSSSRSAAAHARQAEEAEGRPAVTDQTGGDCAAAGAGGFFRLMFQMIK